MSTQDLCNLTAAELMKGYAARTFSPVEVLKAVLARSSSVNPHINAYFHISQEEAIVAARESERRWMRGEAAGELDGVPVSIKDSVAAKGMPMWRGSKAYMDRPASTHDAPPTARLRESGAIVFAKATMPDLGMLAAGISSAHGITRNPWNLAFNTGGSSSGGGAAVAARLGPLAVGSDIGGSVRSPASLCGLAGLKPTQGRIPHLPPSPIRSAGPLARTVEDVARLLTVLAKPDARDHGSLPPENVAYHERLGRSVRGLKIGLMLDAGFGMPAEPAVRDAVGTAAGVLRSAGANVQTMKPLLSIDPMPAIDAIFSVRARIELDHLPPERREMVHPLVLALCSRAQGMSAEAFGEFGDTMEGIKASVIAATAAYDYVISPAMPVVNYPADLPAPQGQSPLSVIPFVSLFNQTGQPAAVVCCGFDDRKLPIGMQIIGRRFDDLGVLQVASAYERARGFEMSWPAL
ncbi:MAG: amidase [Burkholderiaceae bacterium]